MTLVRRTCLPLLAAVLAVPLTLQPAGAQTTPEVLAYDGIGIRVSSPPDAPPRTVQGQQPALTPDGLHLAWIDTVQQRQHVFVGGPSGEGRRQVTSGDASDSSPAWSPDGRTIAFRRTDRDGGANELWTVSADGSGARRLAAVRGSTVVWSPDGRFLAVGSTVVDRDGRHPAQLLPDGHAVDWSPDGTVLSTIVGGRSVGLFTLDRRASATVLVEEGTVGFTAPTFDPTGRLLYVLLQDFDKGTPGSFVQRRRLDGSRDEGFAQREGFGTDIASGGGDRAALASGPPPAVGAVTATTAPSRVALRFARPTTAAAAGVTIRYAEGTVAPVTPTDGLDAGQSLASTVTVERLAPSTTYSFSVFARDWAAGTSPASSVTATTPSEVATTLTLRAPGRVVFGQSSSLTGTVVREDTGAPVAGARVELLGHHGGEPDRLLAVLTTDADGAYRTTRQTSETTRYTVRSVPSGALRPARADALVAVQQRISLDFQPSARVPAGSRASVTVTVAPAFPGGNVRFTQHVYERTITVLTRLDRNSRATFRLDTSRRWASARENVVITPGSRDGYGSGPTSADLIVS